jgi:hypothetical protein
LVVIFPKTLYYMNIIALLIFFLATTFFFVWAKKKSGCKCQLSGQAKLIAPRKVDTRWLYWRGGDRRGYMLAVELYRTKSSVNYWAPSLIFNTGSERKEELILKLRGEDYIMRPMLCLIDWSRRRSRRNNDMRFN